MTQSVFRERETHKRHRAQEEEEERGTKHTQHLPTQRTSNKGMHTVLSFMLLLGFLPYHHFTQRVQPPFPSSRRAGGGSVRASLLALAAAAAMDAAWARSSPSLEGMRVRLGVLSRRATSLSTPSQLSICWVYHRWICRQGCVCVGGGGGGGIGVGTYR